MKKEYTLIHDAKVDIANRPYEFDIERDGNGRYRLTTNESLPMQLLEEDLTKYINILRTMQVKMREVREADGMKARLIKEMQTTEEKRHHPKQGLAWSPEDEDTLYSMYNDGKPREEISEALGRSELSIEMRLDKLGLRNPSDKE